MKRLLALLLATLLVLSSVAAFAEEEKTLHLGMNSTNNYNTYDFVYPWTDAGLTTNLCWLTLLQADKNLVAVEGEIMKSWEVLDDGLTIVMELDDRQWSDGEPITMEDVVWSLYKWCEAPVDHWAYVAAALRYIKGWNEHKEGTAETIEGIEYTDTTLTFHLTAPYAQFVNLMAQFVPLPKHIYENCSFEDFKTDPIWAEMPVTSGMFMVTEHEDHSYVIYGLNPYYKGETPKITKIITDVGGDTDVRARNGELDYFSTNQADLITMMKDIPGYSLIQIPILYFRFLACCLFDADGNPKPYVQDVRVREAVACAINWPELIGAMYGDMAALTQTGVLSSDPNYIGDWYKYDPDYAKQLLDEAGYDYSHTMKIFYYYSDQTTIDIMDAIVYYLSQVGIEAEAVYTNNSVGDIYEGRTGDFAYFGLSAFDNTSWYGMYTRDNMDLMIGSKAIFADAVKELETAYTPELWAEAITKLQNMDKENIFFIPVYTQNYVAYTKDGLTIPEDCLGNTWYYFDYQFEDWDIAG